MSKRDASRVIECQIGGTLLPDLELPFDDEAFAGKTVADVLKDPARYVGATLADPLEGVGYGPARRRLSVVPTAHSGSTASPTAELPTT